VRAMVRPFSLRNAARYQPLGVDPVVAQRAQTQLLEDVRSLNTSIVVFRDVRKCLTEDPILKQAQEVC
jgi:hypothetical protein